MKNNLRSSSSIFKVILVLPLLIFNAQADVCSKKESFYVRTIKLSPETVRFELCDRDTNACKPIGNQTSYYVSQLKKIQTSKYIIGSSLAAVETVAIAATAIVLGLPALLASTNAGSIALLAKAGFAVGAEVTAATFIGPINPVKKFSEANVLKDKYINSLNSCIYYSGSIINKFVPNLKLALDNLDEKSVANSGRSLQKSVPSKGVIIPQNESGAVSK